jgi:hypothetical protein
MHSLFEINAFWKSNLDMLQIKFQARCVLLEYQTMDKVQKPGTLNCQSSLEVTRLMHASASYCKELKNKIWF